MPNYTDTKVNDMIFNVLDSATYSTLLNNNQLSNNQLYFITNDGGSLEFVKDNQSIASYNGTSNVTIDLTTATNATNDGAGNNIVDTYIPKSIGTTKGDIIYWSANGTPVRLGIGSANQVLKVSSSGIPSWSSDIDTDTKVKLTSPTVSSTVATYPIVLGPTSISSGTAYEALYNAGVTVKLQTVSNATQSTITATKFDGLASQATADAAGNNIADTYIPKSIGTAKGDIIYWSASGTPVRLGIGSANQVLKVNSSGIPAWSSDSNTDTKVTQSASTTANWRKILLHYKDDSTADADVTTSTEQVYAAKNISVQPSTGTIKAPYFDGIATKATGDGAGNEILTTYVKKAGDTMTGALNFANGLANKIGDDSQLGDFNVAGTLGIQGLNGTTGIALIKQSETWGSSANYAKISYDGTNVSSVKPVQGFLSAAHYGGTGNTTKIKIKINSTTSWMLSFVVTIYQGYRATKLMISGYNYGTSHWYQPEARLLGDSDGTETMDVVFGYDSDWNLWIGLNGGSYTGVSITDVVNGYTQITDYSNLFTISNVSEFGGTTQTTVTAASRANYAVSAGTATKAAQDGAGSVIVDTYIKKSLGTAAGDIMYWSASGTPARLAKGSEGQVLKINSSGIPAWSSDNNSDTKVKLTSASVSTTVATYPIVLGPTSISSGSTYEANYNTGVTVKLQTVSDATQSTITATKFDGLATRATSDAAGNNINDTYLQKSIGTVLGNILYWGSSGNTIVPMVLAPNTTTTKKFLRMTGTGSAGAAPAWDTVTKSDVGLGNVDNTADANKNVAYATSAGSASTATKATQDGAGNIIADTYIKKTIGTAAGDIIYWSAANTPARLAKGSEGQVLKINSSGLPAWSSDSNTDTKVKLTSPTVSTTVATYPLVFGPTSITSGTAYEANYNTGVTVKLQTVSSATQSTITATKFDGLATKATQDGAGNTITDYYLNKTGTKGDIIYWSANNTASHLGIGTSGQVLKVNSSGVPAWSSDTDTDTLPSAYCTTAAATAAKVATCTNYTLTANSYVHVLMQYANSYNGAITLNINSTGAKTIYINGSVSSSSNKTLPAGTYIAFYDGTNYHFRTDGILPGTTLKASQDGAGNNIADTYIKKSIGTAKGDIIYWSASGTPARLAASTDGKVLKLSSGIPTWSDDSNTDTKVKLSSPTVSTTAATYPLVFGPTSISSGTAYEANYNSGVTVKLQTVSNATESTITATKFNGLASKATQDGAGNTITDYYLNKAGTKGDIIYWSADNTASHLAKGTEGQVLKINSSGVPAWSSDNNTDTKVKLTSTSTTGSYPLIFGPTSISSGTAYEVNYNTGVTVNPNTKTITATTFDGTATKATGDGAGNNIVDTYIKKAVGTTKGDILYWSAASTPARLGIGSEGQVLQVNSSGLPVWSTVSTVSAQIIRW